MSDLLDEASELEHTLRETGVSAVRQLVKPELHPDFDGVHCVDCEVVIHPTRLKMGKVRCVDCQTFLERVNK